jgi:hypothetical protein
MALIDTVNIELNAIASQVLSGLGNGDAVIQHSLLKRDDVVIAHFAETGNVVGAVNYTLSAGQLLREGSAIPKTEGGSGRLFTKLYGWILKVEPVNPLDLTGNPVGLSYQWAGTLVSTVQSLHNGLYVMLANVPFTDAGFALNLDFGGAGTTKKRVTGLLIGSAV